MLGCQDFCGYYDWTFHYVRRRHGLPALRDLWASAIGGDAQTHYASQAEREGLRGLLAAWQKTGREERCDWTFTLDEGRNVLRWDMRRCPSKGFLLENGLNADEDYCDHCMGWVIPLLDRIGARVTGHEHNHCGQCWGEMCMRDRPHESLDLAVDIRRDPRWSCGYIDRWKDGIKLPLLPDVSPSCDPCDVVTAWFAATDRLIVLDADGDVSMPEVSELPPDAVVMTDAAYVARDARSVDPLAVLFGDRPISPVATAERFRAAPADRRPLLMHAYLPGVDAPDFLSAGLPRPVPILPLLIRRGVYAHRPGEPYPGPAGFLVRLAIALRKRVEVARLPAPSS